jgi:hypothetical protein
MSTDADQAADAGLPERVAAALAVAEIPPSKLGRARHSLLSDSERALYFWILRGFAERGRPTREELGRKAEQLGLELEPVLATLRREDLVHLGGEGEITAAYPFSGVATAHRVRFPDGQEAFAMCAIDALGIAPMLDQPIEITSHDPLSDEPFRAHLTADGSASWQPETAVVVAGVNDRAADSCNRCCPVLNFFASTENAERWLDEHPEVRGHVITIQDAIAAGRAIFADVLTES